MDADAVRRWIAGHRAAERRSLAALRAEGPSPPSVAFARAMELCDLVPLTPADDVREREVAEARARWAKVRAWAAKQGL